VKNEKVLTIETSIVHDCHNLPKKILISFYKLGKV